MRADLGRLALDGVPLAYFSSYRELDVVVEMDACDIAKYTLVVAGKLMLRYFFTSEHRRLHHDFQHRYSSERPAHGATISAVLHGVPHSFRSAALDFPGGHPQICIPLKGISRLDALVRHKTPASL